VLQRARAGSFRLGCESAELRGRLAEVRRLRREVGRGVAKRRIQADPGPGDDAPTFTREEARNPGGGLHMDWIWICLLALWERWWPDKVCLELRHGTACRGLQ
jgi:hypothetical protein